MAINFVPQTDYCGCSQCNLRHGRLGVAWCGCLLDGRGVPFMWVWVCGRLLELCSGLDSLCLPSCGGVLGGDSARKKHFSQGQFCKLPKLCGQAAFYKAKLHAKRALCFWEQLILPGLFFHKVCLASCQSYAGKLLFIYKAKLHAKRALCFSNDFARKN